MSDVVPIGWKRIFLGELGSFSTSSVDKLTHPYEQPVKLVNYMDAYTHRVLDSRIRYMEVTASEVERTRSQVHVGDIIFTPSSETPDDIGHSAVIAEDMPNTLHSYHTVRLRPNGVFPLEINFSAWFANAAEVRAEFARKCAGSTRYTLSLGAFEKTKVLIPPLPEQKQIGELLQLVQENIEKTESLIAKYQQIKAGLMHDLFTRGVTTDGKLRPPREQAPELYHETPIGWIPKEWEVVTIGSLASRVTNGFVGVATPYYTEADNGVLYLYGNNVRKDRLDLKNQVFVRQGFHRKNLKSQLFPGDMVTVQSGHIGTTAVIPQGMGDVNCHALIITKFRENAANPYFVSTYCNSEIGLRRMEKLFIGSTILHINTSDLKVFSVPLPKRKEQDEIIGRIETIVRKIDSDERQLGKLQASKQGLMHDLLTGKVRVIV